MDQTAKGFTRVRIGQQMRCVCTLLVALVIFCGPANSEEDPLQMFDRGKKLIDLNCVECRNGTKAGLEQGVEMVKSAVQQGFGRKIEALSLLADAYNGLSTYTARTPAEQRRYFELERQIYRELSTLDPNNPTFPYRRAQVGEELGVTKRELLLEYEKVLMIDPKYFTARFAVGSILFALGDASRAERELRTAFVEADVPHLAMYGRRLSEVLRSTGQVAAADAIDKATEERLRVRSGVGRKK